MQGAEENGQDTIPIKVIVRIRPGSGEIAHTGSGVVVHNSKDQAVSYDFDHCFGPACTTRDIYEVVRTAVRGCGDGRSDAAGKSSTLLNVAILAYGQTGSGKTFTMSGDAASPGLVPLVLEDLLSVSPVRVSLVEIYNERIIDLLDGREKALRAGREGVVVQNLASRSVGSIVEFGVLAAAALANRKTGETALNRNSSRSHLIIRVETGGRVVSLVDLAGSENNRKTGNVGLRMEESLNINRSLFVLSNVVHAIVGKKHRVPYRDSKLTRLLQDSFGGSGICYLVATVMDSAESSSEAVNTLNFASKSRKVVNLASRAVCPGSTLPGLYERLHSGKGVKRGAGCPGAKREAGCPGAKGTGAHVAGDTRPGHTPADGLKRRQDPGRIRQDLDKINIPEIGGEGRCDFIDATDGRPEGKRTRTNTSSLLSNRSSVEMTPVTKQKSYDCFLHKARDLEENSDYRAALEIYKAVLKFADSEFVAERIARLQRLLRKEKTKFTAFKVLEILNSGMFIEIKKLSGIGDKRAQSVVDFIAGGHFFESLSDLKMIFSDKIVDSIMECVE